MATVAFMAPILPGKEQVDKDALQDVSGPRRDEYQASRRRLGITREAVWHQQTPQGTVSIVLLEMDDPQQVFQNMATSSDPFDQWFRQLILEVHGIDLAQPLPGPISELLYDERFSEQ